MNNKINDIHFIYLFLFKICIYFKYLSNRKDLIFNIKYLKFNLYSKYIYKRVLIRINRMSY